MSDPLAIGVDIGGTHLRLALVDEDGAVHDQRRRATPAADARSLLTVLTEELQALPAALPVGVGIAGLVSPAGEVVYGPNIGIRELPLAAELGSSTSRHVAVLNDASAAALAEQRVGAGQGHDDLVLITLGTGVGGGIVIGGHLLVGAAGFAGELGHLIVAEGGRPCPCGNRGCIEAYASGTAIANLACDHLDRSPSPSVLREAAAVTGPVVSAAAADGDCLAQAVLAEVGEWLGVAVASVVNLIDPAVVLIGGGAAPSIAPFVLPTAREAAASRLLGQAFRAAPPIDLATLGDDAGTVGAALYAAATVPERPAR